jgi:hypothetical protein
VKSGKGCPTRVPRKDRRRDGKVGFDLRNALAA